MKNLWLFLFIGLFLFSFANAEINNFAPVKQGQCTTIKQVCASCSYVNISISYPNSTLATINKGMSNQGGGTWTYNFCNTSQTGRYDITGSGDLEGTATGFDVLYFEVNEAGIEMTSARTNSTLFLIFILFLLFAGSIVILIQSESYITKFIFYWASHLLSLLLTFVGWQLGIEGLLGGTALTGIFRIMFWVLTVAMIPMIFVSVAWVVYIHAYNEHFQNLIEKGYDTEEAFRVTNKKKGWMSGN